MAVRKIKVMFDIYIDAPDHATEDELKFMIEENGCPATGIVGAAIDALIQKHDSQGTCWACSANGKSKLEPT